MKTPLIVAALLGAVLASPASAQGTKKIAVLTFDQRQVSSGFNDLFGRSDVNVGRSLANLVARRLADAGGYEIVEVSAVVPFEADPAAAAAAARAVGADAVVAGSILGYGSSSGTAGVSGPRIGGVRLGVGRRTTVVGVSLEARLIDVASGTLLTMIPATHTANRSGLAVFARVPGIISADGIIDMTKSEFSETLLGEATNTAVGQLVTGVNNERNRIGTISMAAPVAAAPMASPAMAPTMPSGPVVMPTGGFAWTPYQFRGTESFRYTVTQTESGEPTKNGFYQLEFSPAGAGQVRMRVQGELGGNSSSNTVTLPVAQAGQGPQMSMGFGQLMAMGPIGIALFNPMSWMFMAGRQLTIGDEWSQTNDGQSMSVKVESNCEAAGQGGVLIVTKVNNRVATESCVSPTVALPLRTLIAGDDGDRIEMVLTAYRP